MAHSGCLGSSGGPRRVVVSPNTADLIADGLPQYTGSWTLALMTGGASRWPDGSPQAPIMRAQDPEDRPCRTRPAMPASGRQAAITTIRDRRRTALLAASAGVARTARRVRPNRLDSSTVARRSGQAASVPQEEPSSGAAQWPPLRRMAEMPSTRSVPATTAVAHAGSLVGPGCLGHVHVAVDGQGLELVAHGSAGNEVAWGTSGIKRSATGERRSNRRADPCRPSPTHPGPGGHYLAGPLPAARQHR